MAVKVDFEKTGRVETNDKATQTTKSTSDKKAENSNVFKALLNELKFKGSKEPAFSLRNRPASSELVKHDHHRPSKNPGVARGLNSGSVNNMAASALISIAAMSSGQNRIGGFYSQRCEVRPARRDFEHWRGLRIGAGSPGP